MWMKKQTTNWQTVFVVYMSDKEVASRIYKEILKLNSKK